uniref:DUF667 domain-containing protein n=1 Tax=Macrostomum lignano TaxID=282301 RepID=A0A1I8FTA4_9PLAT
VFDKELHTYVYSLEGSPSTCKMTLPSDKRKPLSIVHGFLCLQVFLAQNAEFSFELIVTDSGGNRRRLLFSTTVRETACDQLMAKIPLLNSSAKNSWNTLAVDLRAFVAELWREQRYRSLDRVSVAANCRLSRVSTALNEPAESGSAGSARQLSNSTAEPQQAPDCGLAATPASAAADVASAAIFIALLFHGIGGFVWSAAAPSAAAA